MCVRIDETHLSNTRLSLISLNFISHFLPHSSLLEMGSQQQQTVNITDLDLPSLQQVKTQLEEVHLG